MGAADGEYGVGGELKPPSLCWLPHCALSREPLPLTLHSPEITCGYRARGPTTVGKGP